MAENVLPGEEEIELGDLEKVKYTPIFDRIEDPEERERQRKLLFGGDGYDQDDEPQEEEDSFTSEEQNQSIVILGGFNPEAEEQAERFKHAVYDGVSDFLHDELKLGRVRYKEGSGSSREFFNKVRLTYNKKSGKPNGLEFKGDKLYVMRKGEIVETKNVNLQEKLNNFKFIVKTLTKSYEKTSDSVIDEAANTLVDRVVAEDIFENTQTDVRQTWDEELIELETFIDNAYSREVGGEEETSLIENNQPLAVIEVKNQAVQDLNDFIDAEETNADILNGIALRLNRAKNRLDAGSEENIGRQIITALSVGELSQDELSLPNNELNRLVEDKLAALVGKQDNQRDTSEQQQWRKLASDERRKASEIDTQLDEPTTSRQRTLRLEDRRREHVKNAQLYDKVADLCDIRADEIRLQVGLKPESERVVNMLKNNAEADPRTKFQRLAKWLVKNKYMQAGAIVVTILGGLAAMSSFLYELLKKSAHGAKDFGNATYKVAKDTAKYVSEKGQTLYSAITAVGAAVYKVLSLVSGIIQSMAYYMWLVIIALGYFVYTKILGKK